MSNSIIHDHSTTPILSTLFRFLHSDLSVIQSILQLKLPKKCLSLRSLPENSLRTTLREKHVRTLRILLVLQAPLNGTRNLQTCIRQLAMNFPSYLRLRASTVQACPARPCSNTSTNVLLIAALVWARQRTTPVWASTSGPRRLLCCIPAALATTNQYSSVQALE